METDENAHSYSEPDLPISTKKSPDGIYKGEVPINTLEDVKNNPTDEQYLALSVYEQVKGVPYTIEYLDMNAKIYNGDANLQDDKVLEMARCIDKFVIKEINRKNLTNSLESYRSIIEKIKQVLNIDPLEKSESVLKKIFSFFKQYRGVSAYKI